jgi:hypothetical protein
VQKLWKKLMWAMSCLNIIHIKYVRQILFIDNPLLMDPY